MAISEGASVAAIAGSLVKSFQVAPSAAVPAIVDCVLASTNLSLPSLFSALLDIFSNSIMDLSKDRGGKLGSEHSSYIISFTCALRYLLKSSGIELDSLQSFIVRAFLPVFGMINPNDYGLLNQIAELLCDVVIENHAWETMEMTLVPYSLRVMGLSIGLVQNEESAIYQWSRHSVTQYINGKTFDFNVDQDALLFMSESIPLSTASHILTSLLVAALSCQAVKNTVELKVAGERVSPENFARHILWDVSNMAVCMLSQSPEHRSCVIRLLFPFIFRALLALSSFELSIQGSIFIFSRDYFLRKVWKHCRILLSLGSRERQDAYSVLCLYLSYFYGEGHINDADRIQAEDFDMREEDMFWVEIRRGLVDKDALVRKQSLHILKISLGHYSCSRQSRVNQCHDVTSIVNLDSKNSSTSLSLRSSVACDMTKRERWAAEEAKSLGVGKINSSSEPCLNGQQRWEAFLLLYEMLEEYGTHLVEAAWTHQISLLLCFSCTDDSNMNHVGRGAYQIQMDDLEGTFRWLVVLWERGFCHENPQVRCLIMQSFLGINWENHGNCAKVVPESFVLGPFIQGLNDPVHHQDFGVKGVYSSETIKGASIFVRQFSSCLFGRERVAFLCSIASTSRQESFGRVGLMALAACVASSASETEVYCEGQLQCHDNGCRHVVQVESAQGHGLQNNSTDLIDSLRIVLERSKQHFNPKYRLRVCEQVLEAASVVCTCDVPLDLLLHFLASLPRECTDFGGTLRKKVQDWFSLSNAKHHSCYSSTSEFEDLRKLNDFPQTFIKQLHAGSNYCNDEDFDAWVLEANRWARVLFLVTWEEQYLESIFKFIQMHGINICKQNHAMDWMPMKFLIIILSLVQELKTGQEKSASHAANDRTVTEPGMIALLEQLTSQATSTVFQKFTSTFLSILEGLVSFSESACSLFWSCPVTNDALLPCSIRGKLGGPSQRRLASSITTSVLHAISSVKIVASISSWCAQLENAACLNSAFTFLWNFLWKVISSPIYESETRAEIHLAAYEALVPVLKAISSGFSPLAFDLIMTYNKSAHPNGGYKALLDSLVLNFLQSVNDLVAVGTLARSRRAVLTNWKWLSLDSLLSIPYNALENGVQVGCMLPFFSDAALRCIFADLVDSLENAGESSALPMLRSVRLVLGLFKSGGMCSFVSSCEGLDTEMMSQLVHSSWVLHLSCNKRRVAPIAALLSAVLHHSVFVDSSMHEMSDGETGPLKWFVGKVLDEGLKSPRTIRLAALHLTGLFLLVPKAIKYYLKELKLLSLYGSVAFDEDFEAELAENNDARKEVMLLAKSPDPELTEAFINTEIYARVAVAVLFCKLADLADRAQVMQENEDAIASLLSGKLFLLELLDSVVHDKDLAKELYKKFSGIHRRKVRAWQMICVLSRFVDDEIVHQVTSSLHICLYRNNLPAVRQYLETFAIQIYLKFPSLIGEQLIPIFHDYSMRPQALSSYVFIAANVILHSSETFLQLRHLNELLPPMIPFLTSHHHSLRAFTQLLVYQVLCKLIPALDPNKAEVAPLEKKCFIDLKAYLAENSDCMRLRASMQGIIDGFDPNTSATPTGIFTARNEELDFECVPTSLMEQVIAFLNDAREDLRYSMAKDVVTIKNESLTVGKTCMYMELSHMADEGTLRKQTCEDVALDFQKKVTLNKHERPDTEACSSIGNPELQRLLVEMEKEDFLFSTVVQSRITAMERMRGSRQPIILVASLLDRIPNLAGLARTCEVFKAAGLAIADASIVRDKQFQLISVTAEKWVPLMEVPVSSMKLFLETKKREGFSILGLEQTANSTPLDQFSFPKKTVLVLGREKEGIPVDVIHILDACVEIPQLGVIRSLNVHVSGAIALWEYTRQHRLKQ